jgi:hypothetical protein
LAYWDYNPDSTEFSVPWQVVAMRQWSNKEAFPGIAGGVDADVFYGTKTSFLGYGYKTQPVPEEEQWAKSQVIKDTYTFLCGGFSEDEILWRIGTHKNLVEIGMDICQGDTRFYDKWVKPKIPIAESTPVVVPEPPSNTCPEVNTVKQAHDILWGKGWWWVKWFKLKELLPR